MLSLASKTQAVFFLQCTSPCQQPRCWNQPFPGNFGVQVVEEKKKNCSPVYADFIIRKLNMYSAKLLFFSCNGQTLMFLEMLQDCAGAAEGSVGPRAWERL